MAHHPYGTCPACRKPVPIPNPRKCSKCGMPLNPHA